MKPGRWLSYDAAARPTKVLLGYLPGKVRALRSRYDPFGNRTCLELEEGDEDDAGNPVDLELTATWTFDDKNRLSGLTMTSGGLTSPQAYDLGFVYEPDDSLTRIDWPSPAGLTGRVQQSWSYTPRGLVAATSVTGPSPSNGPARFVSAWLYEHRDDGTVDSLSEVRAESSAERSWDFGYDDLGRLSASMYSPTVLSALTANSQLAPQSFAYDLRGNRTGGSSYDLANRQLSSPEHATITPDADGNLVSRTKGTAPNEETETFTWDVTNRLVSYQPHAGGSTSYDYDPFTRRVRKATATETTWYVWDGDVLLAEYRQEGVGPLATTHREVWYGYAGGFTPVLVGQVGACGNGVDDDGDGNADFPLDADCASPGDDTEATTSAGANQCTDATDNDGDTLSDGSDPDCLLDAVEGPEPAVGQCDDGVDNDGQNGTDFPTDGSCLWAADATEGPEPASGQCADSVDNDGDGDFDGADDDCSASLDETEGAEPRVYAVHADHLGTPRLLTDLEGRPVWRALYAAYGRAMVESGSGVDFNVRFPGQYFDAESGLHYNRFRSYDAALGRYLSADRLGQFGASSRVQVDGIARRGGVVGPNPFTYAFSDPVLLADPTGEWVPAAILAVGIVGTGVYAVTTALNFIVHGDSVSEKCGQFAMQQEQIDDAVALGVGLPAATLVASSVPSVAYAAIAAKGPTIVSVGNYIASKFSAKIASGAEALADNAADAATAAVADIATAGPAECQCRN